MNEVSRSEKRESQPKSSRIIMIFHVVHLQQELRLCVHFQMSMQHFVRMTPLRLHILNQSSRRLRRLREGRCQQLSILTRNLQGLVLQCSLPHQQHHVHADTAQGLNLPLAATPMTPSYPPRPPIEALPKHPSMETGTAANKHPLEPPVQQGPPNKHVRPKPYPHGQSQTPQTSMAAPSAVDMSRPGTPCPKGPPAEYTPAPPEVTSMSTSASAVVQEPYVTENGKIRKIRSVTDIDWGRPLYEQLEPNLKGGPRSSTTPAELRMLRAQIPKLTKHLFDGLFPADNTITAVQKNHGVHKIHMSEAAAWVLNATHWFSLLEQPMMVIVWCHNWEDASKFQYLMQTLQVHYGDFVPRYQIFMFDDPKIYGSIQQWQEPTTVWDGKPVLGFMAETFLDDLPVIGFKDFNPMWIFPTTSVNQCWEPMTFGMAPWHICEDVDRQNPRKHSRVNHLLQHSRLVT